MAIDWQNRTLTDSLGSVVADWGTTPGTFDMQFSQAVGIGGLITGDYSIGIHDYILTFDTSITGATISLPTTPINGASYIIKDGTGNASFNNLKVIGSVNIDGNPFTVMNTNYGVLRVVYAGATGTWFTI